MEKEKGGRYKEKDRLIGKEREGKRERERETERETACVRVHLKS